MEELVDNLIAELAPALRLAFLSAVRSMRGGVNYTLLVEALEANNIEAAIDALNIDPASFNEYLLQEQMIYTRAGTDVASKLTEDRVDHFKHNPPPVIPGVAVPGGGEIAFRFDMTNPRAEAKIRTESTARVVGFVEEQKESARQVIADGYARGEGPQSIATDIAGRINPVSKRREGGIIGLSNPQVAHVESMVRRLTSGDPLEMAKVLGSFNKDGKWIEGTGMTLRDRRFDAQIKRAIRDVLADKPNPLTEDKIKEMAAKYSDRLLAKRARDVARTETASAVEMARMESTKQALEKANLPDEAVNKVWIHQGGVQDARWWHIQMNNEEVSGLEVEFLLPNGDRMLYPHDPEGGARNNVNCRCRLQSDINWGWGLF